MKKGLIITIVHGMTIIIIALAFALVPSSSYAQGSKTGNVKYSGVHGYNERQSLEGGKTTIVKGTIYEVSGTTIYMDGESFSIGGAVIVNQVGGDVKPSQLYPGLKVRLIIKNGSVRRVVIDNFYWNNFRVTPEDLEKKRNKELERRGR